MRAVVIFKNRLCPDLVQKEPPNVLKTEAEIIDFLDKFNGDWRDWTFRDVIPVKEKYSQLQRRYFETQPSDRYALLQEWLKSDICCTKSCPSAE